MIIRGLVYGYSKVNRKDYDTLLVNHLKRLIRALVKERLGFLNGQKYSLDGTQWAKERSRRPHQSPKVDKEKSISLSNLIINIIIAARIRTP
ncbi:MAG: hypothetical protein GX240_03815 [Candidatus Atribacteria bacterium]|nr:hypothetical protein [Candidatus Atribacteria bacterium]